jgi:hypothetical protein
MAEAAASERDSAAPARRIRVDRPEPEVNERLK